MVLRVNGTPSLAAARASARSPCGSSMPFRPVGAMTSGELAGRPRIAVRWWRALVSTRVWGISRKRSRASRLARSVTSSSAPPSTYSNAKPGTRRRAISRRSAMLSARDRSLLPNGRRFQGMRDLLQPFRRRLHQRHADARGDEGVGAGIVLPDRDQPVDLVGALEG